MCDVHATYKRATMHAPVQVHTLPSLKSTPPCFCTFSSSAAPALLTLSGRQARIGVWQPQLDPPGPGYNPEGSTSRALAAARRLARPRPDLSPFGFRAAALYADSCFKHQYKNEKRFPFEDISCSKKHDLHELCSHWPVPLCMFTYIQGEQWQFV